MDYLIAGIETERILKICRRVLNEESEYIDMFDLLVELEDYPKQAAALRGSLEDMARYGRWRPARFKAAQLLKNLF